jgi:hypothetical protein
MSEHHNTTHAFLTDGAFEFRAGGHWRAEPFNLGELATADGFIDRIFSPSRLVWLRSREITERVQAILSGSSERYDIKTPDDRDYYTITRKADDMKLSVNTLQKLTKTWEIDRDKSGVPYECETLEGAFSKFQAMFQIKFGYNRGQQGVYILERHRKGIGQRKGETDEALMIPPKGMEPFKPNISDLYFFRGLTKEEKKKTRLVAVDKNSAYPTAASIKLGLVDYDHRIKPQWEGMAGFYRITTDYKDNPLLPLMLPQLGARVGWYDAPALRLLSDLAIPFQVEEAYIFAHQSAVLDKWARTLREQAQALSDSREDKLLRKIIKTTANATVGAFSAAPAPGKTRWYYRPDWRNAIIREHAARIQRDLLSVADRGFHPVAIYNDALYFVCSEDDLASFPFLTDERLSRKYKLAGVYDVSSRAAKKLFSAEHKNLPHEIAPYAIAAN